jgi:GNAT superfamily N-acetyltransferase
MNLRIEKAAPKDVSQIVTLIREFAEFEKLSDFCEISEDDLHAAIFGDNSFVNCLVAFADNALVGYAMFYPVFKSFRGERSVFLEDLYVSPAMRGQGFGLKMLKEVARAAKQQNCARMDWQALKWNTPAIKFYKNLGARFQDENFDFNLRGAAFERLAS